jgi:predicted dehydrogenase
VAANDRITVGVVGLGYWGPNLARNFNALPESELRWCCDSRETVRARHAAQFRDARFTSELDDLLEDPGLDAVVLATPVATHAELTVRVLKAGKHCLVEKPLAQSVADAERAVSAQHTSGKVLMVGHLLQYHPGVERLKAIAHEGELGEVRYIYGHRLNLGRLRADENALWSLGAHDVSVVLHLAEEQPHQLSARGECYMREGIEDVVFAFMRFPSGLAAHLHLSWLDPHKARRFTIVGSKRMATFNDMDAERKLTVYDKGFDESADTYGEYITRSGDIWSPRVPNVEPLRVECEHFLACVRDGREPLSGGENGLAVVRVLEGLQRCLDETRRPGLAAAAAAP